MQLEGPTPWPIPSPDSSPPPAMPLPSEQPAPEIDSREAEQNEGRIVQALSASSSFAQAFEHTLNTDAATRKAATGPLSALTDAFSAVDLSRVLDEGAAYATLSSADGYQRFLVAPEGGVRALIRDALALYSAPMEEAAGAVRDALLAAVETSVATLGPDVPPHLRDRITELASDSVRGWHAEAKHHLGGLLAGEQSCPEVERFAQLRLALLANPQLKQEPAVAGITKADSMEGGQEALIKGVLALVGGTGEAHLFMGELSKLSSKGQWQRRWVIVDREAQTLCYMHSPGSKPAMVYSVKGAFVVGDVQAPGASTKKAALAFQLHVHGEVLTLRASSPAAKQAWLSHLETSIQTSAKPTHLPPLKRSGSASSTEEGAEAAPVPRKISTAVFLDDAIEKEDGQAEQEDGEAAQAAAEQALLADITAEAAKRKPSPREAAVLRLILAVVTEAVTDAGARLQGLTHRLISNSMLLDRAAVLRQDLLKVLLD